MLRNIIVLLHKKKGFSLIELMMVVAIIGILSTMAIPNFLGMRKRAYNAAALSEISNARLAMEMYYTENDSYDADIEGLKSVEQGLATTPNVTFSGISGDTSTYTIITYHKAGNKTYTATPMGLRSN